MQREAPISFPCDTPKTLVLVVAFTSEVLKRRDYTIIRYYDTIALLHALCSAVLVYRLMCINLHGVTRCYNRLYVFSGRSCIIG